MKNTTIILGIVILIAIGGFFALSSGNEEVSGNTGTAENLDGVQSLVLGIKNYNYYPSEIKVKAGEPVSISLDSSVGGCYRSFVIKGLGVSEYSRSPSETIDFTPTKKGKFTFSCSMGMGYGTIIVE